MDFRRKRFLDLGDAGVVLGRQRFALQFGVALKQAQDFGNIGSLFNAFLIQQHKPTILSRATEDVGAFYHVGDAGADAVS